jgi:TPR repeat protein
VPQDFIKAYHWLNLAASRASGENQIEYAEARDALAARMTPDQLAEAQKLARDWFEAFERRQHGEAAEQAAMGDDVLSHRTTWPR